MYAEKMMPAQQANLAINGAIDHNPTVGENIDAKIAFHRAQVDRLLSMKETLGPLLTMKIGDLRDAMNY